MLKTLATPAEENNLYKVVYIALSFMLLFSAFSTGQTLVAIIYKDLGYTNLAQICIFLMSSFSMMGNMFAAQIRKRVPIKQGLVFSGILYLLFILMGTLTTFCHKYNKSTYFCSISSIYFLNFFFSTGVGIGASIIWASQFNYVNSCTNQTNKGTLHGTFWSITQCSMLIGSTMAAFVLKNTDEFIFYLALCCLCCFAIVMFVFLPVHKENISKAEANEMQESYMETVKNALSGFKKPYLYPIISSSFLNGLTVSLLVTYFAVTVKGTLTSEPDPNTANQKVSFALMSLGVGQILAGFSVGRILDKFKGLRIDNYLFGSVEFVTCLCFLAKLIGSYPICIFAGFIWGINDNALKTFNNTLVSAQYKGGLAAFGALRMSQSSGVVLGSLFSIFIPPLIGDGFILMMFALQIGCHVVFTKTYDNIHQTELGIELIEKHDSK